MHDTGGLFIPQLGRCAVAGACALCVRVRIPACVSCGSCVISIDHSKEATMTPWCRIAPKKESVQVLVPKKV